MNLVVALLLASSFLITVTPSRSIAGCTPWRTLPVDGPVLAPFAPEGRYRGHWGVDLGAPVGTAVVAAAPGVVSFSGTVAGMRSVTVDHGGGVRTSYSYLTDSAVTAGEVVAAASLLGWSGWDHEAEALHWSLRVGGAYADPLRPWRCDRLPEGALFLAPLPGSGGAPPMLRAVQRGILGGTFDPPHLAHLVAGEAAYRDLGLDIVSFLPAGSPWQKASRTVSAASHRWAMTALAVDGVDYFEADDREVRRDGWTYTLDTLVTYPQDDLTLVLGADAALGLPGWHRAPELLERARLAVMDRPGVSREAVESAVAAPVIWLDAPRLDVSGTTIRRRISAGKSARFLVSDAVWRYIMDNDMYVTP